MELISREAAIEAIDKNRQDLLSLGMDGAEHILVHYGRRVIEELPTINSVKHGKWIKHRDRTCWYCSECTTDDYYAYTWDCDTGEYEFQDNYCPNCGANMVEGEEEKWKG